ncbi:hypothetical protein [Bradyrhizobium genosp. SA-3]|uniref:hypothetical protein n=1 Tax=Bradyrhizobium genosp. SA-3 TaxID=508868 RepID=UPI00102A4D5A|nr:hypothetical protein [Bradyrhizobium genosp. SA-3]
MDGDNCVDLLRRQLEPQATICFFSIGGMVAGIWRAPNKKPYECAAAKVISVLSAIRPSAKWRLGVMGVRHLGNSGPDLLILASSQYDPQQTIALPASSQLLDYCASILPIAVLQ